MGQGDRPGDEDRSLAGRAGALLGVFVVISSLALAGCIGDAPNNGPTETSDDGTDANRTDPGDATDGDGSEDTDGNASSEPDPRTPAEAMPGREPAETGEGVAKFEITGQASPAISTQVLFDHLVDHDDYDLSMKKDVTLVEVVLTWDSEHADLDCQIAWNNSGSHRCTNHGMGTQEQIEDTVGVPVFQDVNASQWEHMALTPGEIDATGEDYPLEGVVRVEEDEVWEPTSAPGEADESLGMMSYTVQVWVHTVPAEPSHRPAS